MRNLSRLLLLPLCMYDRIILGHGVRVQLRPWVAVLWGHAYVARVDQPAVHEPNVQQVKQGHLRGVLESIDSTPTHTEKRARVNETHIAMHTEKKLDARDDGTIPPPMSPSTASRDSHYCVYPISLDRSLSLSRMGLTW
jgi:hypothetical protein